jgi:hypothetical protein
VGEKTKNLYRFVRWEMDLALELGKPIIVANLTRSEVKMPRGVAYNTDECVMHVAFKMKIIKYALDGWPTQYAKLVDDDRPQPLLLQGCDISGAGL